MKRGRNQFLSTTYLTPKMEEAYEHIRRGVTTVRALAEATGENRKGAWELIQALTKLGVVKRLIAGRQNEIRVVPVDDCDLPSAPHINVTPEVGATELEVMWPIPVRLPDGRAREVKGVCSV